MGKPVLYQLSNDLYVVKRRRLLFFVDYLTLRMPESQYPFKEKHNGRIPSECMGSLEYVKNAYSKYIASRHQYEKPREKKKLDIKLLTSNFEDK